MSRTRNQRRRRIIDRICYVIMLIVLIVLICMVVKQFREIEDMQAERRARESQQMTVMRADSFLPKGFDPECEAYQAALQRYDEENGLVFGQKETAPERASSEAADARD